MDSFEARPAGTGESGIPSALSAGVQTEISDGVSFTRAVQRNGGLLRARRVHADEHVHLAALDGVLYKLFDRILRVGERAGQAHGAIEEAVVDGAKLHRSFPPVQGLAGTAIASHTADQMIRPLSIRSAAAAAKAVQAHE